MSLVYVIDGYNVIKHPFFARAVRKDKYSSHPGARSAGNAATDPAIDVRESFLRYLRLKNLTGSLKNKVYVVFDGYPERGAPPGTTGIEAFFSYDESADDVIRRLVEKSARKKELIVVSDDREVRFFAKSAGASVQGVEEFIGHKERTARPGSQEAPETKVSYSQMERINKELRERWLK